MFKPLFSVSPDLSVDLALLGPLTPHAQPRGGHSLPLLCLPTSAVTPPVSLLVSLQNSRQVSSQDSGQASPQDCSPQASSRPIAPPQTFLSRPMTPRAPPQNPPSQPMTPRAPPRNPLSRPIAPPQTPLSLPNEVECFLFRQSLQ